MIFYNEDGIQGNDMDESDIFSNTINENFGYGIFLENCDNNTIQSNTVLDNPTGCIVESSSTGNTIKNNDCGTNGGGIPGFTLPFLILILLMSSVLLASLRRDKSPI